jgi:hypothetical protein
VCAALVGFLIFARACIVPPDGKGESSKTRLPLLVIAGFLGATAVAYFPFVARAPKQAWFCLIIYPAKYFQREFSVHSIVGIPVSDILTHKMQFAVSLLSLSVILLAVPAVIVTLARKPGQKNASELRLLSVVAGALLTEVFINPNCVRIIAVAMPSVILAVWFLHQLQNRLRRSITVLAWSFIAMSAIWQIGMRYKANRIVIALPIGKVATVSEQSTWLLWTEAHTREGEQVLAGDWPSFYFVLKVNNPFYIDTAYTAENTPRLMNSMVQQVESMHPKYIFWPGRLDQRTGLVDLRNVLRDHYHCTEQFSNGECAWQLSESGLKSDHSRQ